MIYLSSTSPAMQCNSRRASRLASVPTAPTRSLPTVDACARCIERPVQRWQGPARHRRRHLLAAALHPAPTSASLQTAADSQVEETFHTLPDGQQLEMLRLPRQTAAVATASRPPLLFVHGSYHGAWCWREHFMPYFAAAGYDTVAISVRAQGNSDRRPDQKVSNTLQGHADDLASVIQALSHPPILVGHSFGGLLVEKYVSQLGTPGAARPPVAGVALLCAVPPSGNKDIVVRITKQSLVTSFKITWAFVTKSFARSASACRDTFFSADLPDAVLLRYQQALADCSPVRLLDLGALNKELPLPPLPPAAAGLPAFVAGGAADVVVDPPAVEETAAYFGVGSVMWSDTAHDCMLDTRWEAAAASLLLWLEEP